MSNDEILENNEKFKILKNNLHPSIIRANILITISVALSIVEVALIQYLLPLSGLKVSFFPNLIGIIFISGVLLKQKNGDFGVRYFYALIVFITVMFNINIIKDLFSYLELDSFSFVITIIIALPVLIKMISLYYLYNRNVKLWMTKAEKDLEEMNLSDFESFYVN